MTSSGFPLGHTSAGRCGYAESPVKVWDAGTKVFKAFPAIANLADKSDEGKVTVDIEGKSSEGFDPSWLRNAVEEPLDEADIEKLPDN